MNIEPLDTLIRPDAALVLPIGRDGLLRHIPKGGRAAEIGVYKGKFSRKILRWARPSHLTLVDAWDLALGNIPHRSSFTAQRLARLAETIPRRLKWRFPFAKIDVFKSLSVPAADRFQDGELDWIYIDADHSYEGVSGDLQAWSPKVRGDGLILGHDFTDHNKEYGVIRAVADFVRASDYRLLCITTDYSPTFILSRGVSGFTGRFITNVLNAHKFVYQLDTALILGLHHERYRRGGSKTGVLSDFSSANISSA